MPGLNGTGPEGKGSRTGRGNGLCNPKKESGKKEDIAAENELLGIGRGGRPRGGGRGFGFGGGRGFGFGGGRGFGFGGGRRRRGAGWRNWFGVREKNINEDDK
ncbi:DUF5320 domain-containing protein [Bacteroidota bacterium]